MISIPISKWLAPICEHAGIVSTEDALRPLEVSVLARDSTKDARRLDTKLPARNSVYRQQDRSVTQSRLVRTHLLCARAIKSWRFGEGDRVSVRRCLPCSELFTQCRIWSVCLLRRHSYPIPLSRSCIWIHGLKIALLSMI